MILVIKNRSCPYCGSVIDSYNAVYDGARFRLGPPVRQCSSCQQSYIDPHFKEWADVGKIGQLVYLFGRFAAGLVIPLIIPMCVYYWWGFGSETPRKPEEADHFFSMASWGYVAAIIIILPLIWRNTRIQIRNSLKRVPLPSIQKSSRSQ